MYQNDTVNDTYVSENHDEPEEIKIGLVAVCKKLNIRERPTVEAPVICEVVCKTELIIDENESTQEFYKVYTAAGIEGFCMRKFIAIQS